MDVKRILKKNRVIVAIYGIAIQCLQKYARPVKDICYLNSKKERNKKPEDKGEKYLIVRRIEGGVCGIFSNFFIYLTSFEKAELMGRIPVVDMKNYDNPYIDVLGKENAWLFFFTECVQGNSLELAERSGRAKFLPADRHEIETGKILHYDQVEILRWNRLIEKYVHLNEHLTDILNKDYNRLFQKSDVRHQKVLGVKFRGTDYNSTRPKGHYIQPTIEEMIQQAKRLLLEEGYAYIYLATEDQAIVEHFREAFGEKLLMRNYSFLSSNVFETSDAGSAALEAAKRYGRVESGIDYIIDIYLLSKTTALLTSGNSGSVISIIINGAKYENIYFVDKGTY